MAKQTMRKRLKQRLTGGELMIGTGELSNEIEKGEKTETSQCENVYISVSVIDLQSQLMCVYHRCRPRHLHDSGAVAVQRLHDAVI